MLRVSVDAFSGRPSERTMSRNLISALVGVLSCLGIPRAAIAEPAPAAITEFVITKALQPKLTDAAKETILKAYRDWAKQMEWSATEDLEVLSVQTFAIPEGSGSQIVLANYELGEGGVLFILSQDPKVVQRMKQQDLQNYGGKSAFFPSGKLVVSLLREGKAAEPKIELQSIRILNNQPVRVLPLRAPESIEEIRRAIPKDSRELKEAKVSLQPESLCFHDDRQRSNDKRVGRLMPIGCTGWLIQDDLVLSAGHCVSASMQFLEFQVPDSKADGATQPAHINDQYPVIQSSVQKQHTGVGHDWTVFQVGPNSNTGKLPGEQQGGYFKLSRNARPNWVRVTGYGTDQTPPGSTGGRNKDNQTQQTEDGHDIPGGRVVVYVPNPAGGSYFRYKVDTEPGNSGSPVIDTHDGGKERPAIAIHTDGGCEMDGNLGTAVDNETLREAIKHFVGDLSKVYVD